MVDNVTTGLTGDQRDAYTYLPESTRRFVTPEALATKLARAGFVRIRWRTFMFGTMALHVAVKPMDPGPASPPLRDPEV